MMNMNYCKFFPYEEEIFAMSLFNYVIVQCKFVDGLTNVCWRGGYAKF